MDALWSPVPVDSIKTVSVLLHLSASPLEVLQGVSTGYDLSPFLESGSQTSNEVSVTLRWHLQLYGTNQPRPGQVLEVKLGTQSLWIGIVQSINDFTLASGRKSMTVLARSRDTMPRWRDLRRATDIYPMSTPYSWIVQNIAEDLNLSPEEYEIPVMSAYTMQNSVQLADLTPWQMLTTIVQPLGLQPYVSARGVLKFISRQVTRASDIVLDDNRRLVSIQGSRARPAVTEVMVKWLDPKLTEVAQQDKVLFSAGITAGFFQLKQHKDVLFSQDGTQRARNTYLVVRQSANSGLLPVCNEEYEQQAPTGGLITLTTSAWAPALATAAIGTMLNAATIPDGVAAFGGGFTIPEGRLVHAAAEAVIMLVMMSMGTGQYEIWGTPYDSVHTRNKTSSYNPDAKAWEVNIQEIENDFVTGEAMAQNMSTTELIYAYRAASSYNLTIVDDPRVEVGDIVELANGSRVYVLDYRRDLSSGSANVLQISGFNADYVAVNVGEVVPPAGSTGAPINTRQPSVSGNLVQGGILVATPGSWDGVPAPTITGQWYANGVAIGGEFHLTYQSRPGDVFSTLWYAETALSSAGGPTTVVSNHVVVVRTPTPSVIADPGPTYKGDAVLDGTQPAMSIQPDPDGPVILVRYDPTTHTIYLVRITPFNGTVTFIGASVTGTLKTDGQIRMIGGQLYVPILNPAAGIYQNSIFDAGSLNFLSISSTVPVSTWNNINSDGAGLGFVIGTTGSSVALLNPTSLAVISSFSASSPVVAWDSFRNQYVVTSAGTIYAISTGATVTPTSTTITAVLSASRYVDTQDTVEVYAAFGIVYVLDASDFSIVQTRTIGSMSLYRPQAVYPAYSSIHPEVAFIIGPRPYQIDLYGIPTGEVENPVFSANPAIIGTPKSGVAASYVPGTYSGTPPVTVTHEWQIDGSTVSTVGYTPSGGDVGKTLTVVETAHNSHSPDDTATSAGVVVIA